MHVHLPSIDIRYYWNEKNVADYKSIIMSVSLGLTDFRLNVKFRDSVRICLTWCKRMWVENVSAWEEKDLQDFMNLRHKLTGKRKNDTCGI